MKYFHHILFYMSKISDDGIGLRRWLTSRVLIAPLRHRYPCPQSPPCTSDTQSTQGDTCVLQPPGTKNKPANLHSAKQKEVIWWQWGCRPAVLCFAGQRWLCCAACCFLPSSRCELWHSRNTCLPLSLSGICYDVTSLCRSEPLVSLTFSFSTICHVLSLSLTLPAHCWLISLSPICHTHISFGFLLVSLMQDEIMCLSFSKHVI